ncbi:MAG: M13 family metallopeptidase [Chloroflexia bacterium]|nr:M13 family metallopeptidase [Chloroflexia bacterium]
MRSGTVRLPYQVLIVFLMVCASISGAFAQTPQPAHLPQASPIAPPEGSPVASLVATADEARGIQIADMDLSVDPGDDFYQFANGGWAARSERPADQPVYGASDEVIDHVNEQLFTIMDELQAGSDTPEGKARTLYEQVLDTDTRNEQGIEPIQPLLDEIQAIASVEDGLTFQQNADTYQLGGLFFPYAFPSPEDATLNSGYVYGPALSLPSEDYYDDSEESVAVRDAWIATTVQLLMLLGYTEEEATTVAESVIAFETELVGIKTPDAELFSDPVLQNNPRTLEELEAILPSFDWNAFVQETHLPDTVDTLIVTDIAHLEGLEGVLANADPLTLRHLFATQLIWSYSSILTTEIEDIAFSFQGPIVFGVEEQQPLEERALQEVQIAFPDTLSQAYVAEAFPPEAKAQIEELVDNLIAAFRIRIQESTWMSAQTQAEALAKLDLMVVAVGYPDTWETYEDVAVGDSLFETVLNAYDAGNAQALGEVDQPVDRTEWFLAPFEVNAGYDPSLNMIQFPAAILQPPFFDPNADLASNYGSIGAVIGHEITHGFDLSGSQFDGEGNLVEWWTDEDFTAFSALNDQVMAHYSAVEVQPGLMVDGELTVGENVADMGGLQIAYDAMLIALDAEGEAQTSWFLTQQQRFFIAYAVSWREEATPEFYEFLVASDVHAPGIVRAVEPSRHMDEFYEAFDIGPGDPEYLDPEERVIIW